MTASQEQQLVVDFHEVDATVEVEEHAIGQKHYPENLSRCFIINAPILFKASWEVIAVIFSSTTLGKVVTTSDDGGDELLEAVGNKERLGELLALKPEAQTWSNWLGISS